MERISGRVLWSASAVAIVLAHVVTWPMAILAHRAGELATSVLFWSSVVLYWSGIAASFALSAAAAYAVHKRWRHLWVAVLLGAMTAMIVARFPHLVGATPELADGLDALARLGVPVAVFLV
ncbi:MAG: hypothetical protein U1E29_02420, partial [Coriobacteriia bacterium]|nr:hypothetical protein [Coriobacteriia bacterium]